MDTPAELKGRLTGWTVYELRTADPAGTLSAIQALPASVQPRCSARRSTSWRPKPPIRPISSAGCRTRRIRADPPTLEDVFLHLAGKTP